jgi:hypothetical protein
MINCSNCQTENPEGKKFCRECGSMLSSVEHPSKKSKERKRKSYWWIWLILAVAILSAGSYYIFFGGMGMGSIGLNKKDKVSGAGAKSEKTLVSAFFTSLINQDESDFLDNYCVTRADLAELNSFLPDNEKFDIQQFSKDFGKTESRLLQGWKEINSKGMEEGINWANIKIGKVSSENYDGNPKLKKGIHAVFEHAGQQYAVFFEACAHFTGGWKVCKEIEWAEVEAKLDPGSSVSELTVEESDDPIQESNPATAANENDDSDDSFQNNNLERNVKDNPVRQVEEFNSEIDPDEKAGVYIPPYADETMTDEFIPLRGYNGMSFMYKGELKNGLANGKGLANFNDGSSYEGDFKDNFFHGQGTQTFADGITHTGVYVNGLRHGIGTITWSDGSYYSGNWVSGNRTGKGTYVWSDGLRFEGIWQDGKRINGKLFYPNGNLYEGEFKNDVISGYGTFTWKDGSVYEGEWANWVKEGKGSIKWSAGGGYEGQWSADMINGEGKQWWPDGSYYIGHFRNNLLHGTGTVYEPDGTLRMKGTWTDGEFQLK